MKKTKYLVMLLAMSMFFPRIVSAHTEENECSIKEEEQTCETVVVTAMRGDQHRDD